MEILLWPGNPAQGPVDAAEPRVVAGPVFLRSDDLGKDFEEFRSRGVEFAEPEPVDYAYGVRITALDPGREPARAAAAAPGWSKER
jgi:hypothetical protein